MLTKNIKTTTLLYKLQKNTIIIGNEKTSTKRELRKLNWDLQEYQSHN